MYITHIYYYIYMQIEMHTQILRIRICIMRLYMYNIQFIH